MRNEYVCDDVRSMYVHARAFALRPSNNSG